MRPRPALRPCALALGLVACAPSTDDPPDDDRMAAMEAKLEAMQLELDGLESKVEALQAEPARPRPPDVAVAPRPNPGTLPPSPPPPMTGIECEGFGTPKVECEIERTVLTSVLDDPAQLSRQARIVPAMRDGKTQGFKLYGIRPNSLPKAVGLQSGDLITSVDDEPLDSTELAVQTYDGIRERDRIVFGIERRGATMVLDIRFVK